MAILGECPYDDCQHFEIWTIPEGRRLPAYSKQTCEKCNRAMWVRWSRVDPMKWTEAEFAKEFEIDERTKQIKPRKAA